MLCNCIFCSRVRGPRCFQLPGSQQRHPSTTVYPGEPYFLRRSHHGDSVGTCTNILASVYSVRRSYFYLPRFGCFHKRNVACGCGHSLHPISIHYRRTCLSSWMLIIRLSLPMKENSNIYQRSVSIEDDLLCNASTSLICFQ